MKSYASSGNERMIRVFNYLSRYERTEMGFAREDSRLQATAG